MTKLKTARAPGKIILSGEHAAVYGMPALVMAVNRYTQIQIESALPQQITLQGLGVTHTLGLTQLSALKADIDQRYQRYLRGEQPVQTILNDPAELAFYVIENFLQHTHVALSHGLTLHLETDLPVGCGMGASAAFINSLHRVLSESLAVSLTPDMLYCLALQAEHLQHGYSSGVDLYTSLHGGLCLFVKGAATPLPLPDLPLYILNTGKPDCTTGECVDHVKRLHGQAPIWHAFQTVTHAILQAITLSQYEQLSVLFRKNHRLLCEIGVVPAATQTLIQQLESHGCAAKISGAGAIRGEHAGIVLILSENEEALLRLHPTATRIHGDEHGTTSVSRDSTG